MGRATGGTYTLPGGDFVTGTVIRSEKVNQKFNDLATAMTDSLSRTGNGDMLAPLRLDDGSAPIPSLSFSADPEIGFYLAAENDLRLVSAAATLQKWTSTGVTIYPAATFAPTATNTTAITATGTGTGTGIAATGGGTTSAGASGGTFTGGVPTAGNVNGGSGITATGGAPSGTGTGGAGLTATGGAANGRGITALGTGNAPGINATGGAASGPGVEAVGGAPNGVGLLALGTGTGAGVTATGGATGHGVRGVGGATSGMGVYGTGSPLGGEGVRAQAGLAATASASRNALGVVDGYIGFSAVNPNNTVGFSNTVTPMNIIKAWAVVSTTQGGTAPTLVAGFNVAAPNVNGDAFTLPFPTGGFMTGTCCVMVTTSRPNNATGVATVSYTPYIVSTANGGVTVGLVNTSNTIQNIHASGMTFHVVVMGIQ